MARRPDRRRTAAIRRVNLQGLGPSTPIKLANSNTSAEPECLENAAMSAFFTGDYLASPGAPIACRPDWRPASGKPGTDVAQMQAQALDAFDARFAICNTLYGG